jgi:DNA-binding CsgD family transcriptional regulator
LCAAFPDASTSELAEKMGVEPSTMRNLLSGAYEQLNVNSRAAAISRAMQLGLIPPPNPQPEI